jgi:hypothetical protein
MAKKGTFPYTIDKCITKGRGGGSGASKFQWCTLTENEAVLIFKDGRLKGVSGNASYEDVEAIAAFIGSTAESMGISI